MTRKPRGHVRILIYRTWATCEMADCFEYQKNPYLTQASQTEKYLLKFPTPKNPEIAGKFQTPKDPSIIPVTRSPEYPPPWAQKATHVFQQTHSS